MSDLTNSQLADALVRAADDCIEQPEVEAQVRQAAVRLRHMGDWQQMDDLLEMLAQEIESHQHESFAKIVEQIRDIKGNIPRLAALSSQAVPQNLTVAQTGSDKREPDAPMHRATPVRGGTEQSASTGQGAGSNPAGEPQAVPHATEAPREMFIGIDWAERPMTEAERALETWARANGVIVISGTDGFGACLAHDITKKIEVIADTILAAIRSLKEKVAK